LNQAKRVTNNIKNDVKIANEFRFEPITVGN